MLLECEICGGGGAIGAVDPNGLRITNCTLDGNAAPAGGAVFLRQAPQVLIDQVSVDSGIITEITATWVHSWEGGSACLAQPGAKGTLVDQVIAKAPECTHGAHGRTVGP